jgi:FtsP/CotA-like multicopper oxidase with cupredoxin domain
MGPQLRSKKNGHFKASRDVPAPAGHIQQKMIRIGIMADRMSRLNRRELMAGLGVAVLGPAVPGLAAADPRPSLLLQARAGAIALRPGGPETPIWSLAGPPPDPGVRFKRGEELEITFQNDLPVPAVLNWHGIAGAPAADPLTARPPLVPGARETYVIPLRQAGILLCDLRLLSDGQARPSGARAWVVEQRETAAVDRDEILLIEDWRLRPDGTAIAPGIDPGDTAPVYTVNGKTSNDKTSLDIPVRTHERLRLRFINGCQRNVLAVKIE